MKRFCRPLTDQWQWPVLNWTVTKYKPDAEASWWPESHPNRKLERWWPRQGRHGRYGRRRWPNQILLLKRTPLSFDLLIFSPGFFQDSFKILSRFFQDSIHVHFQHSFRFLRMLLQLFGIPRGCSSFSADHQHWVLITRTANILEDWLGFLAILCAGTSVTRSCHRTGLGGGGGRGEGGHPTCKQMKNDTHGRLI